MPRRKVTFNLEQRICDLHKQGYTKKQIIKMVGITNTKVTEIIGHDEKSYSSAFVAELMNEAKEFIHFNMNCPNARKKISETDNISIRSLATYLGISRPTLKTWMRLGYCRLSKLALVREWIESRTNVRPRVVALRIKKHAPRAKKPQPRPESGVRPHELRQQTFKPGCQAHKLRKSYGGACKGKKPGEPLARATIVYRIIATQGVAGLTPEDREWYKQRHRENQRKKIKYPLTEAQKAQRRLYYRMKKLEEWLMAT